MPLKIWHENLMDVMSELSARQQIVAACQRLYNRNMLAAADGNVSIRLNNERVLITPSGIAKGFITPEQVCAINLKGEILEGQPSAERAMHLEIYRQCEKAVAVVHAHPPHAIAWSVGRPDLRELPSESLPEVILACGRIPIIPYARPTTEDMGANLREFLPRQRAMILARHGAVTWGETIEEAINGMERVEHSSQILFLSAQLGKLDSLPAEELKALRAMREQMGDRLL
jgi:L-fuculose-phosphate aldolase